MIVKLYHTLKYLKPVQIYGRFYSKFKKPFTVYNLSKLDSSSGHINTISYFIQHDPWNSNEKISDNKFTFLNKSHSFGNKINWCDSSLPLLWNFNLHYFAYLSILNEDEARRLIYDWIKNNPVGTSPAWHSYTTSLRIANWIKSGIREGAIDESLYKQCAYLYRNLEFYHPANHYLENAKALIFGGMYFNGSTDADKWYKKGVNIYKKNLAKMIFDDGFFFELSPMYHLIILEGILDILNIGIKEIEDYNFFKRYAEKMLNVLPTITHPNGELVLFNDTTLEIAPSPDKISDYAARMAIFSYGQLTTDTNESGLFAFKNEDVSFIIDGGKIGPDHIPAHAHADIFSYELFYKDKKIITDSGVYEYAAGEMRDYCRGTMAHNTVSIDSFSQAEIWGGFRVARRYKPYDVSFKEAENKIIFEGKFNGYSQMIGDDLIHKRNVQIEKKSFHITVIDEIAGFGNHLIESFIHLHPDVTISEKEDYLVLSAGNDDIKLMIVNGHHSIETGWYCPEFGKRLQNQVVRIYSNQAPVLLKYIICSTK